MDRIDVSKSIGVITQVHLKCVLFVCNECLDLLIMPIDLNSTAILNIIINGIIKSEALNLLKKSYFSWKSQRL